MTAVITSRPWLDGVYVANLLSEYLKSIGHSVIEIPNDICHIPDKFDFAFGWGCNKTLAYIRDELKIPIFVFDLGMIKRTECPMSQSGYFRFGFGTERWMNWNKCHNNTRWNDLNIEFKNNRCESGITSVMGQVPMDASHDMNELELTEWTIRLISQIKLKYPDNTILYKFHPLVVGQPMQDMLIPKLNQLNIIIDTSTSRIESMDMHDKYRAMFSYCSTSLVHAIINGIPVVASKKSMFSPLISDIDDDWNIDFLPDYQTKQKWFNTMAFSQWNQHEISDGTMWNSMKYLIE